MNRTLVVLPAMSLIFGGLCAGCNKTSEKSTGVVEPSKQVPASTAKGEPEVGFESLFNGRDLSGWAVDGEADSFTVEDGSIKAAAVPGKRQRNWLFTTKQFSDVEIRAEFKFAKGGNSGVCPHGKAGDGGGNKLQLHVKVRDDGTLGSEHSSGTIAYVGVNPIDAQRSAPLKPLGEWNALRIVARGPMLTVWINDVLVNEQDLAKAVAALPKKDGEDWGRINLSRRSGAIGLQVMVQPATYYRNLRAKSLSVSSDGNK